MRIKQADFRTVQIEKLSLSCRLRYSLYQDGEIRYPESITCRGDTIVAYFLTSTIRDFVAETPHGFCIERHWNIVPEGSFGLSFCLELPTDPEMAYLFPGVRSGRPVPRSGELFPGERTCYANGLFLFRKPESLLIFSDPPASPEGAGSIEVRRLQYENEADFARAEIRVPAAVKPPEKETRKGREERRFFRSDGQLQYNLRLNVVTAPPDQIYRRGVSAVLERNKTFLHPPPRLSPASIRDTLANRVEECLKMFLIDRGPLCGLLETKGGNRLSSLAGCTLALIQLRFLSADTDAVELALRLADFSLKGQHPRGQFFPYYRMDRKTWLPPESTVAIPLRQSAAIALMLLRIASALESKGIPASAYLHAASHMGDSLLQGNRDLEDLANLLYPDSLLSAGAAAAWPGEGSPMLVELFLELHKVTGKDKYRKAVRTLKSSFLSQKSPPLFLFGLDENATDLDTILIHAQAAVLLDASGYPVKALHYYFDAILSRVHLNRPGSGSDFNPVGGINHALGNPILLFRGFELSHTLLTLDTRMNKSARLRELKLLISQLLGFTLQKPPGTSYFDPTQKRNDRFGALSSPIWTRESYYMARLLDEFPEAVPE
jgi:hypothetical protein